MQTQFTVQIGSFHKINKIPNAWSNDAYLQLMALMGLDDGLEGMDSAELREMCMMSLNDLGTVEAAKMVLTHLFSGEVTEGKIDQLANDMASDRLWEEYSDCLFHERFFSAYALLREAFNGVFAQPTGVEFSVNITAENTDDLTMFDQSLHPAMVRLLAGGLSPDALMHRLYEDQISGNQFPEAEGVLWQLELVSTQEGTRQYHMVSSEFWFGQFAQVEQFDATSHPDVADEDE
ncbi:hypothetical protein [Shewanella saliphila]|uniref:Uncharacterized protein n=1 Tax=Shewanella saliphila TaxID=2282698 RepID=A0ABQ2Q599_9GAMM|nr:hypothetical protein [Shewanella saliphila]MCL1101758.1 hypothetical protein [Shewanella saliphila]GGP49561.1 hypothetical protein GCM10009409_15110 [Shewanella saliphila]